MKDHHHHRSDSDSESTTTSRKGSLDIPRRGSASSTSVSGSLVAVDGIPKSPLGQRQVISEGDDGVSTVAAPDITAPAEAEEKGGISPSPSSSPEKEQVKADDTTREEENDDGVAK